MTQEWLPSGDITATPELMNIITLDNSVSVLAGAGAGKTELLAQKANYLLETNKCIWPKKILCLSFKTEAQANIRDRVTKRCTSKSERFNSYTFHAFGKSIVDRFKNALPETQRPTDNYDIVMRANQSNGRDKIFMGTLIKLAIEILKARTDICDLFSLTYSHVFIDEFQDTTNDQYELIRTLFKNKGTKLLAVGDINQSIMLWADARQTVFEDYSNDFTAHKKLLLQNYRASEEIQAVLRTFLKFVGNSNQIIPPLAETITNCKIHSFKDEFAEANYLTTYIDNLIHEGIKESEICVLTKQLSSIYTEILRAKLSAKGIRNLDMTDLQDTLKEPLGVIFSLLFKIYTTKSPKCYTELCDNYLMLHKINRGEEKEEELINELSNHISLSKGKLSENSNADQIITVIKESIQFFGVKKIKARWNQYKSKEYFRTVWRHLGVHLRNTINATDSLVDAAYMFRAENSVQLMNIHKCKGLEYKVVIFMGLEDQAFWNYSDDNFEDKCALHVALSRAKEKIFITISSRREHRINYSYDNRDTTCNKLGNVFDMLINKCKFQKNW